MAQYKLLLIDDDQELTELLTEYLEQRAPNLTESGDANAQNADRYGNKSKYYLNLSPQPLDHSLDLTISTGCDIVWNRATFFFFFEGFSQRW